MCRCFEMSQKEHMASCSQLFLVLLFWKHFYLCSMLPTKMMVHYKKWKIIAKDWLIQNECWVRVSSAASIWIHVCLIQPPVLARFFRIKLPRLGDLFIDNVFLDKCDLFSLRLGILSLLPPGSECAVWLGVCGVWVFSPCLSGFSWLLPQHKDMQLVGSG